MRQFCLVLFLFCSCSYGQVPKEVSDATKSVGQVYAASEKSSSYGSCVYIGGRAAVTAWHVIDDGKVVTIWQGGEVIIPAKVIFSKSTADQAVLELESEPPVAPVMVVIKSSVDSIVEKHDAYLCGFEAGVMKRTWRVTADHLSSSPGSPKDRFLVLRGIAKNGMSGGALFDSNGRLLGNISATSDSEVYVTSNESLVDGVNAVIANSKSK